MGPWHRYVTVGPWLTETLGMSASAQGGPSLQIAIVPGNPGSARFYEHLIKLLHGVFKGQADVVAISHLGHDRDSFDRTQVWCLDSQIIHKRDFFEQHVLNKDIPTVIMGHSIGAYMIMQALDMVRQRGVASTDSILQVLPCMPFFSTDWSSARQHLLYLASHCSLPLSLLAGAVGSLPVSWQQAVLKAGSPAGELESHCIDAAAGLMRRHVVRNNFHLAWHEFKDLDKPYDWELLRSWGPRAAVVAAPSDMWFPVHHLQEMREQVPGLQILWRETMSHAFPVSARQCEELSQLVLGLVQEQQQPRAQQQARLSLTDAPDTKRADVSEADVAVLLADAGPSSKAAARAGQLDDTHVGGQDRAAAGARVPQQAPLRAFA